MQRANSWWLTQQQNLSYEHLTNSRRITYTALLVCIGLLLPQIFHVIGGSSAGKVFLPMHIPVIVAGMILGYKHGFIVGLILPIISSLIVGMPLLVILPFMTAELVVYGVVAGLTRKFNGYINVIATVIIGRAVYFLLLILFMNIVLFKNVPMPISVLSAFVTGLPGLAIQILLLPPLVGSIRRKILCKKI